MVLCRDEEEREDVDEGGEKGHDGVEGFLEGVKTGLVARLGCEVEQQDPDD